MFERRPTRHNSLDDLRGYGRKYSIHGVGGDGGGGYTSADDQPVGYHSQQYNGNTYKSQNEAFVRLPPITGGGGGGARQMQQYNPGLDDGRNPYYFQCVHPQAKICQNLRHVRLNLYALTENPAYTTC